MQAKEMNQTEEVREKGKARTREVTREEGNNNQRGAIKGEQVGKYGEEERENGRDGRGKRK